VTRLTIATGVLKWTAMLCVVGLVLRNSPYFEIKKAEAAIVYENSTRVAFDAESDTTAFDAKTADNRILIVGVHSDGNNILDVQYNSVSLTKLIDYTAGWTGNMELWYLVNPASGSNDLYVSVDGSQDTGYCAVVLSGIDTNDPIDVDAGGATGASFAPSIAVNDTSANAMIVDFVAQDDGGDTIGDADGNQVEKQDGLAGAGAGDYSQACSILDAGTGGNKTMSWTANEDNNWDIVAVSINQFTAPPAGEEPQVNRNFFHSFPF